MPALSGLSSTWVFNPGVLRKIASLPYNGSNKPIIYMWLPTVGNGQFIENLSSNFICKCHISQKVLKLFECCLELIFTWMRSSTKWQQKWNLGKTAPLNTQICQDSVWIDLCSPGELLFLFLIRFGCPSTNIPGVQKQNIFEMWKYYINHFNVLDIVIS